MELRLNGLVLPIAQLGPDFLLLRKPVDHAPTEAEIFMSIDGRESIWSVWLPDGLCTGQRKTPISGCLPAKGSTV
jgi:hypothetical protein